MKDGLAMIERIGQEIAHKRESDEAKHQKTASFHAIVDVVWEMIPDEVISPHEAKHIYQHEYHYGHFQMEMLHYCWTRIARTSDAYFPADAAEAAKRLITEGGFVNSHNVYLGVIAQGIGKNISRERENKHLEPQKGEDFDRRFDELFGKLGAMELSEIRRETYHAEVAKKYRNMWDRLDRDHERQNATGERKQAKLSALLIKKRNKDASPESRKRAVREMTEAGAPQVDIARKLGLTDRRVRQIQRELQDEK